MKKLLLGIFTIAAMTSCVKEHTVAALEQKAISFDNFVQHTKAIDPSFNNGDNKITAFYVWGFMTAPTGVVFDKELVSYDAAAAGWTYTNLQYWAPSKSYKFAALAPVNNDKIQVTLANGDYMSADGVLGTVAFENVDGTVDLVYAEDGVDTPTTIPADPEKVHLTFQHLLSKIKFTFTNGLPSENNTVVIENVKLVVPAKGNTDLAVKPYVWDAEVAAGSATTVLEFGNVVDANGEAHLPAAGVGVIENERLTIPFATSYSALEHEVSFDVTIYSGDQVAQTIHKTAVLTADFKAGKTYNITATLEADKLGLKPIDFTVVVEDWVDGGSFGILN